jgi:hypothetical protein
MPAVPLDLTSRHDYGLTAAVLFATAPLVRYVEGGPGACRGLPAALDHIRRARRLLWTSRRIDSGHRDRLRQMLVSLEDYSRAISRVLASEYKAASTPGRGDDAIVQAAEGFGRLGATAGELLRAIEALDAI